MILPPMMFVTCINSHAPSRETISNTSRLCKSSQRTSLIRRNFFLIYYFKLMISKLKAIVKHDCYQTKNKQKVDDFNRCFEIAYEENTMDQHKRHSFSVDHRVHVPIIVTRCTLKLILKISRAFKIRLFKTQHLEKQYIKNDRGQKVSIKTIGERPPVRRNPSSPNRQKTYRHPNPEPPVIFNIYYLHSIPAFYRVSLAFLRSFEKLLSLKTLEFSCLSLQKHGAFFLSTEVQPFKFLGFFNAITNLTHRICGKP